MSKPEEQESTINWSEPVLTAYVLPWCNGWWAEATIKGSTTHGETRPTYAAAYADLPRVIAKALAEL